MLSWLNPAASAAETFSSEPDRRPVADASRAMRYRPDIDGLRTVAVVLVVLFHAFPSLVPGGFVGVDVFFCVSGYLITSILERNFRADRFSVIGFYIARIRRIFPALALVLLATGCFGYFVLFRSEFAVLMDQISASVLLSANIYFFYHTGYFSDGNCSTPPQLSCNSPLSSTTRNYW